MREATGTTPDRDDRLLDQFNWGIVPVRLRLWRATARRRLPKCHAAEHLLVTATANGVPRNSQGSLMDNLDLMLKQSGKVKATSPASVLPYSAPETIIPTVITAFSPVGLALTLRRIPVPSVVEPLRPANFGCESRQGEQALEGSYGRIPATGNRTPACRSAP